MKKYLYTFMIIAMGTACASERNIDNPCNYITDEKGETPTYRQALTTAIKCFSEQSQSPDLVMRVQKALPQAIELFGHGTQVAENPEGITFEHTFFKNTNRETTFNYTFFYKANFEFYDALSKIKLPFIINEEAQNLARDDMHLFDIRYALSGIIRFHAYNSTGGDS